jgi:hypothetical protein
VDVNSRYTDLTDCEITVNGTDVCWSGYIKAELDIDADIEVEITAFDFSDDDLEELCEMHGYSPGTELEDQDTQDLIDELMTRGDFDLNAISRVIQRYITIEIGKAVAEQLVHG